MVCAMKVVAISLLLIASGMSFALLSLTDSSLLFISLAVESKPLVELFGDLMKRHTEIKNQQLMQFISKAVPYGIEPPNPKIAE